jgi:raffinose/stachyose/melibiose transport system permease protein
MPTDAGKGKDATSQKISLSVFKSVTWHERAGQALIWLIFIVYAVLTLVPFYFLFVRTFVSTSEMTELHLWLPPRREVDMNYTIGGMMEFNSLDLPRLKAEFGIPDSTYIKPSWTMGRVAEEFNIPESDLKAHLYPYVNYNGWIVLLGDPSFWQAFVRTIVVTILSLIGVNALSILTGLGVGGRRYRYQRIVFGIYLSSMVIPTFLILVPQYIVVQWLLHLIPNYTTKSSAARQIGQMLALVMLYIRGGPVSTLLFASFIDSVPRDLEDAAEMDGASRWQYLRHILLPILRVPLASLTVIRLPGFWNDFMGPFVYTDHNRSTLLPLINSFVGEYSTNFQVIYTGVFIATLPLLLIYILFRKQFIKGVMAGAIK